MNGSSASMQGATRIAVCGAAGRMGQNILRLAAADAAFAIAGTVEDPASPAVGTGSPVIVADLETVIAQADVVIDFSAAAASARHAGIAAARGKALVLGTTGLDEAALAAVRAASQRVPVIFTPNMSVGVTVLLELIERAARALPGYDVEIIEMHHNKKKDAPSGTALALAAAAARALGRDLEHDAVYGRHGMTGARTRTEIGISAVRAGDIVGDHTVILAGAGERLELTHRAHSRDTLAAGALRAARWSARAKPGMYDMRDVLGFR